MGNYIKVINKNGSLQAGGMDLLILIAVINILCCNMYETFLSLVEKWRVLNLNEKF